ncbi:Ig-like domain-containing protein [Maribacter sp. 2307ULW6-5]|uniref:Ig-like domain-containing protein n=1 Tax=Maribacter sp. 2307ULW6-5 TaxID=3386275 RepID=UPI0039BD4EA0
MQVLRKILAFAFVALIVMASYQCARRGAPTGGPKDETAPVLLRADPPNMSINFNTKKIRLYFDELIQLKDVQEQLIISPPLKYLPEITPQGGANKFIEIILKDTLLENTTYTFNFGQSIVDNNEGNANAFLNYVFSTGDYLDSLVLRGVVKDAFNKEPDDFISVMLYKIDSTYNDSTVYKRPPTYLTNTLDSAIVFELKNLKEGNYAIFGLKDASKDNIFDQKTDKIGFLQDTITLPTDSIYLLNLFKEVPDYSVIVPSMVARNKISFGYYGDGSGMHIKPLTPLPDSVRTTVLKENDKDTLNFWFTPFEMDSIVFEVTHEALMVKDTFNVIARKVEADSLTLSINQRGELDFGTPVTLSANTPIKMLDTTKVSMQKQDSIPISFKVLLDSAKNTISLNFEKEPETAYGLALLPGAVTDFFGTANDTLNYAFNTKSLADYGNLSINLAGASLTYPVLVQLTNDKGETQREQYATEPTTFEFNAIKPANYLVRVIFDENENGKWDTGSLLEKRQPERIAYYPTPLEIRANWEVIETFTILD